MIESMLAGVPVLATARGSVPEVIDEGVTGAICKSTHDLVVAARRAEKQFDRQAVRARALRRWTSARMADDYLALYRTVLAERESELNGAAGA